MKRLLFAISLALLIHAILLFGDFSHLQLFSLNSPELKTITMTLFAYSPPIKEESPRNPTEDTPVYEAPDAIADMEDQSMAAKQEMLPEEESIEPLTEKTPLESSDPDTWTDDSQSEEPSQAWRKPKRSLKALTRVKPEKVETTRYVPQNKISQREKYQKKEAHLSSDTLNRQKNPKPAAIKSDASQTIVSKSKPSLASTLSDAESVVASVNKKASTPKIQLAKPMYRHNPPPKYPRRARRKGYEGTVVLEVLVDEKGDVKDLKVFKTSGYDMLDKSALSSVQKWLFEPGTKDGKIAKMWVRVPIRFKLN